MVSAGDGRRALFSTAVRRPGTLVVECGACHGRHAADVPRPGQTQPSDHGMGAVASPFAARALPCVRAAHLARRPLVRVTLSSRGSDGRSIRTTPDPATDLADDPRVRPASTRHFDCTIRVATRQHHGDHADTEVEHRLHLGVGDVARALHLAEDPRLPPAPAGHARIARRQGARG